MVARQRVLMVTLILALFAAPLAAEAQQAGRVARIAYLGAAPPRTPDLQRLGDEFLGALRDHGYVEGQNLVVERRYADGRMDRLPALARELVRLNPEVIAVGGDQATKAVKDATGTIPIVTQKVAPGVGVQLHSEEVRDAAALAGAFARMSGVDALVTLADSFTVAHRATIVSLAASHRLPAVYGFREFVGVGGLLSYGPSLADMFRAAGRIAARILKGAKPADLPVEQPTKYELVINMRTARALGLTISPSVLARADEIIE